MPNYRGWGGYLNYGYIGCAQAGHTDGRGWEENYFGDLLVVHHRVGGDVCILLVRRAAPPADPIPEFIREYP